MKTKNQCVVAIIGAGYMAREHIRAFQDIPEVKIEGITSRTKTRAEALAAEFNIPFVCGSIDELNAKTSAKLVVITVPELSTNPVSRACFEYPWMILMEKPAGYNLADAEDIEAAARAKNSKVFVALNRRFYSSTQKVLQDLKTSKSPRFIHVQDQEDQQRALQAGQPPTVVDYWMYANSVHVIDYLTLFGRGRITSVEPVVAWDPDHPWIVISKVKYDSGDVGLYEGVWEGPGPWSVSINTPEKRWEMRPLENASFQLAGQRKLEVVETHPWDQEFKPGLRLQAENAVLAAQGFKTELPTLEDSLKSMQLVKSIFGM
jgi:predicted dehydrogenase